MSKKPQDPEALEAEYRQRLREIRADPSLSWEHKERRIRELGLKFDKAREEIEEAA